MGLLCLVMVSWCHGATSGACTAGVSCQLTHRASMGFARGNFHRFGRIAGMAHGSTALMLQHVYVSTNHHFLALCQSKFTRLLGIFVQQPERHSCYILSSLSYTRPLSFPGDSWTPRDRTSAAHPSLRSLRGTGRLITHMGSRDNNTSTTTKSMSAVLSSRWGIEPVVVDTACIDDGYLPPPAETSSTTAAGEEAAKRQGCGDRAIGEDGDEEDIELTGRMLWDCTQVLWDLVADPRMDNMFTVRGKVQYMMDHWGQGRGLVVVAEIIASGSILL